MHWYPCSKKALLLHPNRRYPRVMPRTTAAKSHTLNVMATSISRYPIVICRQCRTVCARCFPHNIELKMFRQIRGKFSIVGIFSVFARLTQLKSHFPRFLHPAIKLSFSVCLKKELMTYYWPGFESLAFDLDILWVFWCLPRLFLPGTRIRRKRTALKNVAEFLLKSFLAIAAVVLRVVEWLNARWKQTDWHCEEKKFQQFQ